MGICREALRYNFQFLILTLAVRIWIPAERRRLPTSDFRISDSGLPIRRWADYLYMLS